MKRLKCLIIFISTMILLTGCSSVIDLNDDESEAIAEYCAELLLKYDTAFVTKYSDGSIDEQELAKEIDATEDTSPNFTVEPKTEATEATTETPSTTETVTTTEATTSAEVTEASTEAPTTEETFSSTTESASEDDNTTTESSENSESPKKLGSEQDIGRIAGISGVSITFNNSQIVDRYPSQDKEGNFIYLESSEGMKLIVLEFDVVNNNEKETSVDLMNVPIEYRIVMNNQKAAKPMLTILMDDLTTYQATLAPGSKGKAVVVFQIADNLVDQIETLDLRVTYGDSTNVIIVK